MVMDDYAEITKEPEPRNDEWKDFLKKAYLMGIGMATGAYDMFVINFVLLVLGELYTIGKWEKSLIATSSLLGTVTGQLMFGLLGDKIGRKNSSVITCCLLVVGAIGSGTGSYPIGGISLVLFAMLSGWRLLLGIGIGGEYPVTAIFTGESSNGVNAAANRGKYISAMFGSQGLGNVLAACLFLLLLMVIPEDRLNIVWRVALIFGGIPPLLIFFPRYKMTEAKTFQNAKVIKTSPKKIILYCWKSLLGTAGSWFLFDIVFYGNSLFSGPILEAVGISNAGGWAGIADNVAFNVVITLIALPGYWTATLLIDRVGRKTLQLAGFIMMFLLYLIIGLSYEWLRQQTLLFVVLYGFSYFFANAGPNTTTFVIPIETYPTVIRSTCHGLSAASGKAGAIVGAFFMQPLLDATSPQVVFIICSVISVIGALNTFFFVKESKGIDLVALDNEILPHIIADPDFSAINEVEHINSL